MSLRRADHPVALLLVLLAVSCSTGGGPPVPDPAPETTEKPGEVGDEVDDSMREQAELEAEHSDSTSQQTTAEHPTDTQDATSDDTTQNLAEPETDVPDEGRQLWAVVLAGASEPSDPLLEETVSDLSRAGHETNVTNCDRGAAEALGMNPSESYTVSVYADSEEAAMILLNDVAPRGIVGVITQIRVECPE